MPTIQGEEKMKVSLKDLEVLRKAEAKKRFDELEKKKRELISELNVAIDEQIKILFKYPDIK